VSDNLPALTGPEAERLRAIARCEQEPYFTDTGPNHKRQSTSQLLELGYLEVRGRQVAGSGRVMKAGECVLTERGQLWLSRNEANR
jgi:hypothetical protein